MSGCFRFVHLADIHADATPPARDRLRRAVERINGLSPAAAFVVTGGDLVEDATIADEDSARAQFAAALEGLADLRMPVHWCLGNHDLFGIDARGLVTPEHPLFGRGLYSELVCGDTNYAFDHGGWHFAILDTLRIEGRGFVGEVDGEALAWLAADLAAMPAGRPLVVIGHLPLGSFWLDLRHGPCHATPRDALVCNSRQVFEVLEPYRPRLFLAGHTHVLEQCLHNGTWYVTGGALRGGWGPGPLDGPGPGFGVVDVADGRAGYQYLELDD